MTLNAQMLIHYFSTMDKVMAWLFFGLNATLIGGMAVAVSMAWNSTEDNMHGIYEIQCVRKLRDSNRRSNAILVVTSLMIMYILMRHGNVAEGMIF